MSFRMLGRENQWRLVRYVPIHDYLTLLSSVKIHGNSPWIRVEIIIILVSEDQLVAIKVCLTRSKARVSN